MKYTIDCFAPVDDKVLDMATFEKFLKDRIKVRVVLCCRGCGRVERDKIQAGGPISPHVLRFRLNLSPTPAPPRHTPR